MVAVTTAGVLLAASLFGAPPARAEDGHELWLRYHALPAPRAAAVRVVATQLVAPAATPTQQATRAELSRAFGGLLGVAPAQSARADRDGALLVGTPQSLPQLAALRPGLAVLGGEGYAIRSLRIDGHAVTAIAANSDIGALYGAFRYLRLVQAGQPLDALDIREAPRLALRVLNHWDGLDRHVERGYAGESIWDWHKLPGWLDPRYVDYARANASIGINGAVLNNVSSDSADALSAPYLDKVAALAGVLRPYGIRTYLTARFSAPIELGGLETADPLDPRVARWWRDKAEEIYRRIPDFGGFLVKANSEGQPGPQGYGRTHADGANLLADALAPHGGVVFWRAFVYAAHSDDRAKQAYAEFAPLDGRFRDNAIVQVKNGPIDFQPREPFHPLFGAMPRTRKLLEVQVTKEYLGFATHLAYLGPLFEETLDADTFADGEGSTVATRIAGIAGVANIGSDRNWCGSVFDQANWYAFGRLAWDPGQSARAIAEDWTRMTFGNEPALVAPVVDMMMGSREAVVDYMTPLGLHHLMARDHHYGPAPWDAGAPRADWNPVHYHRADAQGIGFERGPSGSDAVAQYAPPLAEKFADPATTPEPYLLWFHRLPWTWRMRSGDTLWNELVAHYDRGVDAVKAMRATWDAMAPHVDAERFEQTHAFLAMQQQEAQWWRDASIAYWQSLNRLPLPVGHAPPPRSLAEYQALRFPFAPGRH